MWTIFFADHVLIEMLHLLKNFLEANTSNWKKKESEKSQPSQQNFFARILDDKSNGQAVKHINQFDREHRF